MVNVATAADGAPLLLISRLAIHTKNIEVDPRVSLMIGERRKGDPLGRPRHADGDGGRDGQDPKCLRRRYLDRQPEAEMFAGFADFSFSGDLQGDAVHLVAGFGRIVDLKAGRCADRDRGREELVGGRAEVLAHMNQDHAEACRLYATKLLGAPDGAWRCVGGDPEGLELAARPERAAAAVPAAGQRPDCAAKVLEDSPTRRGPTAPRRWRSRGRPAAGRCRQ